MRKLMAMVFILVLVLFIAGCAKLKITDMPQNGQEDQAGVGETEVSDDIAAAGQDSSDLSSETAENLDKDLEDFDW